MVAERNIESWEELIEELDVVERSLGDRAETLLYRGQASSAWKLETTLERKLTAPVSLGEYYELAHSAKTRIETFTGATWNIPTPSEYNKWVDDQHVLSSFSTSPTRDYLFYLRHHGFPSPFLDWSASPYIAIFFAFRSCSGDKGPVSLYSFLEYASSEKVVSTYQPHIDALDPNVSVHPRHVFQQSRYTICFAVNDDYKRIYANHEQVLRGGDKGQDELRKYNVPVTERTKVLRALNRMDINSFSLFGSEDSLIETISTNEIIERGI